MTGSTFELITWRSRLVVLDGPAPGGALGDHRALVAAVADAPDNRPTLRRLAAHLQPARPPADDDDALRAFEQALQDGRIHLAARQAPRPILHPHEHISITDLADLAPSPQEQAEPEPTFVELQVLYEDGRPYADTPIRIDLSDGSRHDETLDGDGIVRLDDIEPGTCTISFPDTLPLPDPQTDPLTPPAPDGQTVTVSRRAPGLVRVQAGHAHRIVIRRARVYLLQMEDIHFQLGRAVLLADGEPPDDDEQETAPGVTSLGVAAQVLRFAREHPEQRLLVAGHTDTTGSATFNADLSEARATNVQLYLAGDAQAWADHCAANAADEDAQRALKWVARARGWACDPGTVDNDFGPRSQAALAAFRTRYERHAGSAAGSGSGMKAGDYAAMFTLYDEALAELLGEGEDPAAWRESLTFVDPPTLPCGESWPEEAVGHDNYPSAQNRRVDLLFFDEDEIPPDLGGGDPPGESIYGDPMYVIEPLDVDPDDRPDRRVCFEIAVAIDDVDDAPPGAALRLLAEGYDLAIPLTAARAAGEGLRAFRYPGVLSGGLYRLVYEADGIDPIDLFVDRSLDPFLDGIGEEDTPIEPLPVATLPGFEVLDEGGTARDLGPQGPDVSLADLGQPGIGGGLA